MPAPVLGTDETQNRPAASGASDWMHNLNRRFLALQARKVATDIANGPISGKSKRRHRSKSSQQEDMAPKAVDAPTSAKSEIGVVDNESHIAQPESPKSQRRRRRQSTVIIDKVEGAGSNATTPNDHKSGCKLNCYEPAAARKKGDVTLAMQTMRRLVTAADVTNPSQRESPKRRKRRSPVGMVPGTSSKIVKEAVDNKRGNATRHRKGNDNNDEAADEAEVGPKTPTAGHISDRVAPEEAQSAARGGGEPKQKKQSSKQHTRAQPKAALSSAAPTRTPPMQNTPRMIPFELAASSDDQFSSPSRASVAIVTKVYPLVDSPGALSASSPPISSTGTRQPTMNLGPRPPRTQTSNSINIKALPSPSPGPCKKKCRKDANLAQANATCSSAAPTGTLTLQPTSVSKVPVDAAPDATSPKNDSVGTLTESSLSGIVSLSPSSLSRSSDVGKHDEPMNLEPPPPPQPPLPPPALVTSTAALPKAMPQETRIQTSYAPRPPPPAPPPRTEPHKRRMETLLVDSPELSMSCRRKEPRVGDQSPMSLSPCTQANRHAYTGGSDVWPLLNTTPAQISVVGTSSSTQPPGVSDRAPRTSTGPDSCRRQRPAPTLVPASGGAAQSWQETSLGHRVDELLESFVGGQ